MSFDAIEKEFGPFAKKKETDGKFRWIGSLLNEHFCIIVFAELDYILVVVIYTPVKIRLFCKNHMQQQAIDILREIGFRITHILYDIT